jgi:hypothetical protein
MQIGDLVTISMGKHYRDMSYTHNAWKVVGVNETHVRIEAGDDKVSDYFRGPHILPKSEYTFTPAGRILGEPGLNLDAPLQTRLGHPVRIYDENAGGDHPIVGAYLLCGVWEPTGWTRKGGHWCDCVKGDYDLVNAPK